MRLLIEGADKIVNVAIAPGSGLVSLSPSGSALKSIARTRRGAGRGLAFVFRERDKLAKSRGRWDRVRDAN